MTSSNLYEEFYKPLEPSKPESIQYTSTIIRDHLGFTPDARSVYEHKLSYTSLADMIEVYPDLKESLTLLHSEIGSPSVKSVDELTFSELWEQLNMGVIRKDDVPFFQTSSSLYKDMSHSQRIKLLSLLKTKYKSGVWLYPILMDIIDPFWQQKKEDNNKSDWTGNNNDSSNVPFFS